MNHDTIVHDHRIFRAILRAMSRPGQVQRLPEFAGEETAPVELLRCLVDNATRVAVLGDDRLAEEMVQGCQCRPAEVAEADFIVVAPGANTSPLEQCRRGDLFYPDGGATIVYLVDGLAEDRDGIALSGPGIKSTTHLRVSGLGEDELTRLARLNRHFPLGVDAMFLVRRRRGRLACIPRSTRIGGR